MKPKSVRKLVATAALAAGISSVAVTAASSSPAYYTTKEYCNGGAAADGYSSLDKAVAAHILNIEHRDIAHYRYRTVTLVHGNHTIHSRTWKCS